MYDFCVFFGFIAFVLLPCFIALLGHTEHETENDPAMPARNQLIKGQTSTMAATSRPVPIRPTYTLPNTVPETRAIFIAPVRRDTSALPYRVK